MQNGNLKHKVQGADTPLLSSQVLQLTPMTADSDDLAVSCTCQLTSALLTVKSMLFALPCQQTGIGNLSVHMRWHVPIAVACVQENGSLKARTLRLKATAG